MKKFNLFGSITIQKNSSISLKTIESTWMNTNKNSINSIELYNKKEDSGKLLLITNGVL